MATTPTWTGERQSDNTCLNEIAWSGSGGGTGATAANQTNGTQLVQVTKQVGAAHVATSQVTASTSAATVAIARATRRTLLLKNTDATITVYIGPATVTSANGIPLRAGESVVVTAVTLWQVIAASGSPVVAVGDEYD